MNALAIAAMACWAFVLVMTVYYERMARKWLKQREEREAKGLLIEVGTTLTINAEPLTVYKIEGKQIFTTTSVFTERVQ